MIQKSLSFLLHEIKENIFPVTLVLIALLLDLSIAAKGPYFHWPHWSAAIFPLLAILPITLSFFYLGRFLGAFATYLFLSFLILEISLGFLTGSLSNDLLCAMATSGGFHHFKFQLFVWGFAGIGLSFFTKRFFKRNLKASAGFSLLAILLLLMNIHFSFHTANYRIKAIFFPKFQIGISRQVDELIPLFTPSILSQFTPELRHAFPGVLGDLMALVAFAHDPGADTLPRAVHPLPEEVLPSPQTSAQNIVFIMGESSTSARYHAYGYKVETTPELDQILSQNNACKIDKVHSAANQTRDAVLPSVSLWFPQDSHQGMNRANLIEIAKMQNYKTYWASVQSERGAYSGFIGYIAKYADHFIDPETKDFNFNGKKFSLKTEKDEDLLPLFEAFSSPEAFPRKKFIFLHLWGSHLPYDEKIRQQDVKILPKASNYDRSIHRTDRLIAQIVQTAQKNLDNPLIIYLPDHGEDPANAGGHSLEFGGKDYEIPLILIGEKAKENCAYIETLRADNGWYSSNMNKFLILRLLGLNPDYDWVETQRTPDLVLHVGGKVYPWGKIPGQHLND